METIRIPNDATYSPVSLTDLALIAPLISRVALGASVPGLVLQTVALSAYAGSALQDFIARFGVRPIDFMREYGSDVRHMEVMPEAVRQAELTVLAERLNDGWTSQRPTLEELAVIVDRHLTNYIAGVTGQRVETSTEVRTFSFVQFLFPFALGAADILSGDIAIFHDTGVFQPHVLAHEFSHRKGYWRELDAQALAYLALTTSDDAVMVQSALCERLYRNLRALTGEDEQKYDAAVKGLQLRSELVPHFLELRPAISGGPVADAMRTIYDMRMRLTGQNGISDYDVGFTNFLYTFETSTRANQKPPARGGVH